MGKEAKGQLVNMKVKPEIFCMCLQWAIAHTPYNILDSHPDRICDQEWQIFPYCDNNTPSSSAAGKSNSESHHKRVILYCSTCDSLLICLVCVKHDLFFSLFLSSLLEASPKPNRKCAILNLLCFLCFCRWLALYLNERLL